MKGLAGEAAAPALWIVASDGLVLLVLAGLGVDKDGLELVALILALGVICQFLFLGLRGKCFWDACAQAADEPDALGAMEEALALAPCTGRGALAADALDALCRDAYGRIDAARRDSADYRDYIELWSHEVKAPLAAASLALGGGDTPAARAALAELERTEAYVEQALYYARSYGVERDLVVRPVALSALAGDALRARMRMLMERGVAIETEGLDLMVSTDPKWAAFVVGQLLDNAAKYTRPGVAPRLRLTGRVERSGTAAERVVLAVEDNGLGVPAADRGRVFDKGFTGANGRRPDQPRATGLGLYLVSVLAERMGLGVALFSDGASFTRVELGFPAARAPYGVVSRA